MSCFSTQFKHQFWWVHWKEAPRSRVQIDGLLFQLQRKLSEKRQWKLCIPHRLKAFSSKRLPKPFWKNQVTSGQGASKINESSCVFSLQVHVAKKEVITSRTARSRRNDLESFTIVVGTWLWPRNILISLTHSFHTLRLSDEHQRKD